MKDMDYLRLFENSYYKETDWHCQSLTKLEYLSLHIFDFTTYDTGMDELFGRKALEVCLAITNQQTFEYQQSEEGYLWYLIMVNMPFFAGKLNWGTSIRGAWWDGDTVFKLESSGLYEGDEQILEPLLFNREQWISFVKAMEVFIGEEESCPST